MHVQPPRAALLFFTRRDVKGIDNLRPRREHTGGPFICSLLVSSSSILSSSAAAELTNHTTIKSGQVACNLNQQLSSIVNTKAESCRCAKISLARHIFMMWRSGGNLFLRALIVIVLFTLLYRVNGKHMFSHSSAKSFFLRGASRQ